MIVSSNIAINQLEYVAPFQRSLTELLSYANGVCNYEYKIECGMKYGIASYYS